MERRSLTINDAVLTINKKHILEFASENSIVNQISEIYQYN